VLYACTRTPAGEVGAIGCVPQSPDTDAPAITLLRDAKDRPLGPAEPWRSCQIVWDAEPLAAEGGLWIEAAGACAAAAVPEGRAADVHVLLVRPESARRLSYRAVAGAPWPAAALTRSEEVALDRPASGLSRVLLSPGLSPARVRQARRAAAAAPVLTPDELLYDFLLAWCGARAAVAPPQPAGPTVVPHPVTRWGHLFLLDAEAPAGELVFTHPLPPVAWPDGQSLEVRFPPQARLRFVPPRGVRPNLLDACPVTRSARLRAGATALWPEDGAAVAEAPRGAVAVFVVLPAAPDPRGEQPAALLAALSRMGCLARVQAVRMGAAGGCATVGPARAARPGEDFARLLSAEAPAPGHDLAAVLAEYVLGQPAGASLPVALVVGGGEAPQSPLLRERSGRWAWYLALQRRSPGPLAFAGILGGRADPLWEPVVRDLAALSPGASRPEGLFVRWGRAAPPDAEREALLLARWAGRQTLLARQSVRALAHGLLAR
jgi:hypothetical protein